MAFEVNINDFSGPLDLMLHLISEHKLDLMNLDINELTTQYIAYINSMQNLHLEIASEYLVELANLIMIKSRSLLPVEQDELEDTYEEDPKEKLAKRLIIYEKFKEVTPYLNENYEERALHHSKIQSEINIDEDEETTVSYDMNSVDLIKALEKMYQRIALSSPLTSKYDVKEVSVDERKLVVMDYFALHNKNKYRFEEIFETCNSMQELVTTFVVLLDMAKHGEIHFNFLSDEEIEIEKGAYNNERILD